MSIRPDQARIVVAGAGQAGARTALALRAGSHAGPLLLLGEEGHLPYERPQLSKAALAGTGVGCVPMVSAEVLAEAGIDWRPHSRAVRIVRDEKLLVTEAGEQLSYDALVLALGGRPRMPGGIVCDQRRIFALRTADDAAALDGALSQSRSVLVVGGGWLGLEIAAAARGRGLEVTVVEAGDRLCGRAAPPDVSAALTALHEAQGVRVLLGTGLQSLAATASGVAARLDDGEALFADIAVVAIGLVPNVELAERAGLAVDGGIVVDGACRTEDAAIFAVGDCSAGVHPFYRRHIRLESWQNANTQADIAAAAILGHVLPTVSVPWFWSDQFDLNVQMLGDLDERHLRLRRGEPDGSHSVLLLDGDRLAGIVAFNAPRDIGMARKLIAEGARLDPARAADPATALAKARLG